MLRVNAMVDISRAGPTVEQDDAYDYALGLQTLLIIRQDYTQRLSL